MRRGEIYRVPEPPGDRKASRTFVIVSRQRFIDTRFATVICAPIYTTRDGIETQVDVGPQEGLKHDSAVHCDVLMSISKRRLTDRVGEIPRDRLGELDRALRVALAVE